MNKRKQFLLFIYLFIFCFETREKYVVVGRAFAALLIRERWLAFLGPRIHLGLRSRLPIGPSGSANDISSTARQQPDSPPLAPLCPSGRSSRFTWKVSIIDKNSEKIQKNEQSRNEL